MKVYFIIGTLFYILIVLSSCNSQGSTTITNSENSQKSIGKIANDLDPKASLIYQASNSSYWFGSDKGVYNYDGKRLILFTSKDGLISHRVIGVQEDKAGNIYFDTPKGVSRFDGQQFATLKIIKNSAEKNQWKSGPGDLWFRIGWHNKGPFRYDGKKLYSLEFPKSKIEDKFYAKYPNASYNPYGIYSMYKDSKGCIWFGTSDLGIYRFDGNLVSWMNEEHLGTMPNGGAFGIRSIVEDKNGFFWICNTSYKYKILSDSINDASPALINYKREKGITDTKKEVQYFMAMVTDNKGDLWMVNVDGTWRSNGKSLKQVFIKDNEADISPTSVYKDKQGTLWFGTNKQGIYKYNGKTFEKFQLN